MIARLTLALFATGSLTACASNVSLLNLGAMPVGGTVDARVQYYDVSAASLAELRMGMVRGGPRVQGRAWQAATQREEAVK